MGSRQGQGQEAGSAVASATEGAGHSWRHALWVGPNRPDEQPRCWLLCSAHSKGGDGPWKANERVDKRLNGRPKRAHPAPRRWWPHPAGPGCAAARTLSANKKIFFAALSLGRGGWRDSQSTATCIHAGPLLSLGSLVWRHGTVPCAAQRQQKAFRFAGCRYSMQ